MAMTPEERTRIYTEQTTSIYAGIGEFTTAFELMVDAMRRSLLFLWTRHANVDERLFHPALAGLTADPIAQVHLATFATAIDLMDNEAAEKEVGQKVLVDIHRQLKDLIQQRNKIQHGTWQVGWAAVDDTDFSVASWGKTVNTKTGARHDSDQYTREVLDMVIDRCREVTDLINRVSLFLFEQRFSFSRNFVWNGKCVTLNPACWTFKHLSVHQLDRAASKP